jgi:uncharacterized protein YpmS
MVTVTGSYSIKREREKETNAKALGEKAKRYIYIFPHLTNAIKMNLSHEEKSISTINAPIPQRICKRG